MASGVTVTAHGARAEEWRAVFGTDMLPVVGPVPHRANLPGLPGELVYELDLGELAPATRERLIAHLARRFGLDPAIVAAELDECGVPLPAEGLIVTARGTRWLPL